VAAPIEDYAIIGDTQTAALVCRDGSIDWLCLPRFDSAACFASLLGSDDNGHWTIAPVAGGRATRRCYRDDTLVLESEWDTADGTVRVIDFMPPRGEAPDVVRIVEGVSGRVPMQMTLRLRFDYGNVVPWVRRIDGQPAAIAGPDAVYLRSDEVDTHGEDYSTRADFSVTAGERVRFVLTWHPSHLEAPAHVDPEHALTDTVGYWADWSKHCATSGPYGDTIVRSAVTLKALTYGPTGGIVAAATTSLPEDIGGVRNWDYRFCWLRDASLTLQALLSSGYTDEAQQWREWLLRAIAGSPEDLQIMYGVAGERRLPEWTVDWLSGYEGSSPVRVGNGAAGQLQLDVYGEVLDALSLARERIGHTEDAWSLQRMLVKHLQDRWREPDEGLWEVRGPRQQFTHSKVMCWVAFDRAAQAVEKGGMAGPAKEWRATANEIHRTVCAEAYDAERNTFVQAYGSKDLDASLLLIPRLGFLPGSDPRVAGTVDAISQELCVDGFVRRYSLHPEAAAANVDGLPGGEGAFLACSFWLADALHLIGRRDEAKHLFDRLLGLRNDVGLLAEEYDPVRGRQVGNFPQAFSHVGLINTAALLGAEGAAPV
jgi:GH15 family glucan-1,4-alpha-glucosidase